jgi:lysine 2,3-aminomutase
MKIENISRIFKSDVPQRNWRDWRWQYRKRIHVPEQLSALLGRSPASFSGYMRLLSFYPFCITPYYLSLMDPDDENNPLRKQCFPDLQELDFSTGGVVDPLGEERNMPVPGLVHRYPDRCLTIVTNVCAVYCRYCNRKRRWGKGLCPATKEELQAMIDYISKTPGIREVIVSGGDPLTLDEDTLDWFFGQIRALPHIEVIRVGSRIPVVLPWRITKKLCAMLRRHRPLWFNTQFNHALEITAESARACAMLLDAGIPLSNQSVLLKGINDTYEALHSLFCGLQKIGVRPYYLFQCDAVAGTGHFRVEMDTGVEIMEKLRKTISGLCLPRYVLDTPGNEGKITLAPAGLPGATSLFNICKQTA